MSTETGRPDGSSYLVYTEPRAIFAHVGTPHGNRSLEPFGIDVRYDITLTMSLGTDYSFSEQTRFWIYRKPDVPHDYECVGVYPSLNQRVIALKRVKSGV